MGIYKLGLDFGTHQTKICIEDSSDKMHKRYFFHRFIDLESNEHWTFPSVVQVNKDKTLSYGFTNMRDVLWYDHAPGDPPKKPEEPVYRHYKQVAPIVKPKEPQPFVEDKQDNKKLVVNDFAALLTLVEQKKETEQEIRKRKKDEKIAMLRYESEMRTYNKACLRREEELEKDKKEVDRTNAVLREYFIQDMEKYEQDLHAYNSPHPAIFRNFKQAIFSSGIHWPYHNITPEMVAVWYLSFIFFDIEKEYGNDIVVCMGTSSGRRDWQRNKQKATQIMLSVYNLVENVCENDKSFFLSLTIDELIKYTKILPFSQEEKEYNSIFIFPEAYANINPLAQQRRFGTGINAIIDIGGGTTDISIFSAFENPESEKKDMCIELYDYISIPYGINAIDKRGVDEHFNRVNECIQHITSQLLSYAKSIGVDSTECNVITNYRPSVFSGGGSLRNELCKAYGGFSDIIHITSNMVSDTSIDRIDEISKKISMLNTALGLAKCNDNDSVITLHSYDHLFSEVRKAYRDKKRADNMSIHREYGLMDD